MNAAAGKYIDECRECAKGRRGWVNASHARAKSCGLSLESLHKIAAILHLTVARHGRYGWTATKRSK